MQIDQKAEYSLNYLLKDHKVTVFSKVLKNYREFFTDFQF